MPLWAESKANTANYDTCLECLFSTDFSLGIDVGPEVKQPLEAPKNSGVLIDPFGYAWCFGLCLAMIFYLRGLHFRDSMKRCCSYDIV